MHARFVTGIFLACFVGKKRFLPLFFIVFPLRLSRAAIFSRREGQTLRLPCIFLLYQYHPAVFRPLAKRGGFGLRQGSMSATVSQPYPAECQYTQKCGDK